MQLQSTANYDCQITTNCESEKSSIGHESQQCGRDTKLPRVVVVSLLVPKDREELEEDGSLSGSDFILIGV